MTVFSKGQIVLPAGFRRQDRIEAGQAFDIERLAAAISTERRCPRPMKARSTGSSAAPRRGFSFRIRIREPFHSTHREILVAP